MPVNHYGTALGLMNSIGMLGAFIRAAHRQLPGSDKPGRTADFLGFADGGRHSVFSFRQGSRLTSVLKEEDAADSTLCHQGRGLFPML